MSYNCDTFKVKKLENLRMPLQAFYKHDRKDWHPERTNHEDGTVELINCETSIKGFLEGDMFVCRSIDCFGEGSGTFIDWILEPALKESTGELVVSCVWEGGDSINKLIVKDGDVKWENIDI